MIGIPKFREVGVILSSRIALLLHIIHRNEWDQFWNDTIVGTWSYSKISPDKPIFGESSHFLVGDSSKNTIQIPYVGHIFLDLESARIIYYNYFRQLRYDVRFSSFVKVNSQLCMKRFCCSKQGISTKKKDLDLMTLSTRIGKSHNTRANCKAQVTLRLDQKASVWKVHIFMEDQSHDFVMPSKRRPLSVNCHINLSCRRFLDSLNDTHILPSQ